LLIGLSALPLLPQAESTQRLVASGQPKIAIIIDDLGHNLLRDQRALSLPTSVAVAVIPATPHAQTLAAQAAYIGHEVLVHMPMESAQVQRNESTFLSSDMDQEAFEATLKSALMALPQAVGLNNHQGSRLTAEVEPMRWLMHSLSSRGDLYFVDSRTSAKSIALRTALDHQVPALGRHVFLDNERDPEAIVDALQKLADHAKRTGYALAIGHPHPETIDTLEWALPQLAAQGIRLVPPSQLMR